MTAWRHLGGCALPGLLAALALAVAPGARAEAAPGDAFGPGPGGEITVATASNFGDAMARLARAFEAATGHRVRQVNGSSGKHFAQILRGAPFDAYFAADAERPRRLEARGGIVSGSRFTYALGVLVLYSPEAGRLGDGRALLLGGDFNRLALANPRLAPYGQAAIETLESIGALERVREKIVLGENVAQAMAFVRSGNAQLGLVALAQLRAAGGDAPAGSHWRVPAALHRPIEQQAVLLRDTAEGRAFLDYVRGEAGRALIGDAGYLLP